MRSRPGTIRTSRGWPTMPRRPTTPTPSALDAVGGRTGGAVGTHREAAAYYERALRSPPDSRSPSARLLERLAQECYLSAQIEEATAAQQEALECHRTTGDRLREGNALRELSRILFFAGRTDEGEAAAEAAVVLLEQLPLGHELALAYCNVSQRQAVLQKAKEAVEWGGRALEVAERLDDTEALVYALTNIGMAELGDGQEHGPREARTGTRTGATARPRGTRGTDLQRLDHVDAADPPAP